MIIIYFNLYFYKFVNVINVRMCDPGVIASHLTGHQVTEILQIASIAGYTYESMTDVKHEIYQSRSVFYHIIPVEKQQFTNGLHYRADET